MPDPTTAELLRAYAAIHEAEPETRPKHIRFSDGHALFQMPRQEVGGTEATDDAMLALCRCALEDWLMERGWEPFFENGGWWCVNPLKNENEVEPWRNFPTIHTALHAAFWSEKR